jgi:tetratricopeptide (TPR) repeat protein
MSPAQAARIGNGLVEDADAQTALMYLEYAREKDASSIEILIGLARCYYELRRDDEALVLYRLAIAQNPAVWAGSILKTEDMRKRLNHLRTRSS